MPVYSHSRLGTYENCPRQYKLRYIDRIELPEGQAGIEAFLGSRVHDALEKLYKELILAKLNTLDDLLRFYKTEWDKNYDDEAVAIVKKGFKKEHYYTAGIKAITDYYNRYRPFNQTKTIATEMMLVFKIGDYSLQGFIDRLSHNGKGCYEIHDYKTSGSLPSQDKMDNDRQLALYQIGIKEKFRDVKDVQLIWHYLLFDSDIVSTRTDTQLKDLKKQIISLIKTIEKDSKFEPVESRLCDWCDYPEYCPAKKHEFKLQTLSANKYLKEKGVTLVNKYASVKAKIKALRDQESALQMELDLIEEAAVKYAQEKDTTTITGSDHALKITESTALSFPKSDEEGREELELLIKKAGIWEEVSGLNMNKLGKLIERDAFDKKTLNRILKFAEEEDRISVRLVGRKEDEQ